MKPIIRYWGRKTGSIAEPYIIRYSKPGDIILDPFGGAGSIAKSAILLGRRFIYSDLNPLAVLIARVEIEGVDVHALETATRTLLKRQRLYYQDASKRHWVSRSSLYEVRCMCGARREASYFIWHGDVIVAAKIKCSCGDRSVDLVKEITITEPVYDYPHDLLWYSNGLSFKKRRQVNAIPQLFTKRNLLILSAILKDIKTLKTDERTKRALFVAFASILYQASKMSRQNGGTWSVNCYWIPKVHVERNPYLLFKSALNRIKRLHSVELRVCTSAESVINNDASLAILNSDAKELPLPDNSTDLIITDPPFTDEIQYFELSYMAASWLGLPMPFDDEIIVNHNQGKNFADYYNLLSKAFTELYRVLKPTRRAIIMLHDEDEEVLNTLIELVKASGFIIDGKKKEQIAQRQIGDRDSIKGKELLILNCYKP